MWGGAAVRDAWALSGFAVVAFALAGCGAARIPAETRLPRPDHVYVYDFRASPASVNVDTNQFSYVMGGLAMARDARSREADAAAARQAIATTLLAQLRGMGLPAVPAHDPPPPAENALLITGAITNITEAIPADLAEITVGAAHSQVNARSTLAYQLAGTAARPWRDLTEAAPVVPSPGQETDVNDTSGVPLGYLSARTPEARTAEVAGQAQRLTIRLAAQLRTIFQAQGWVTAPPAPVSGQ